MSRIDTFNNLIKWSFPEQISTGKRVFLMADVLWERLVYKTEIQDYFQYEFYKLKNMERRKYMTFSKLRYTIQKCNDHTKRELFDDKVLFNETFSANLNRDWIDLTTSSFEEFEKFIEKHPAFFAKARNGMFGKNAGKYEVDNQGNLSVKKELFEELKKNGCIVEQLISQHYSLEKFNESSVNTLRIVTLLCADGKPRVMAGVLRIGRAGKTADNFHHYGIAATIDIDTGIVNSPGIDREFRRYIIHPDSGEQIIGFRIPSWEKAVQLVKDAAMQVPSVRYVGWDVAVDVAGQVLLIEGNYGADPDVTQMPAREGKWTLFEDEIEKII